MQAESWIATGGFKLNDGNVLPGQCPHRFFESEREILHVFYETDDNGNAMLHNFLSKIFKKEIG